MFQSLSDRLESAFKVVSGTHKITEINVAEEALRKYAVRLSAPT